MIGVQILFVNESFNGNKNKPFEYHVNDSVPPKIF